MSEARRRVLASGMRAAGAIAAVALTAWTPSRAAAQTTDWPSRPLRLVVPFAPGAANDVIGRLIASRLSESLRQPVTVENRPGAGGALGAGAVAKAAPDGYTLGLVNPGPGVLTPLITRGRLYRVEDLEPVAVVCSTPLLLVVATRFPANTVAELVEHARANPKRIAFGTADAGGITGIAQLLFVSQTGIEVNGVPYSGSAPAMTDIAGGHLDAVFASYASAQPQIKAGRAKVLGVAGPRRLNAIPNVPTMAEAGIHDAEAVAWFGIAAPAGTPRAIVERLNRDINDALAQRDVRERLQQLDLEPVPATPEEFRALVQADATRAKRLIAAGLLKTE